MCTYVYLYNVLICTFRLIKKTRYTIYNTNKNAIWYGSDIKKNAIYYIQYYTILIKRDMVDYDL